MDPSDDPALSDSDSISDESLAFLANWNEYMMAAFIGLPHMDITDLLFQSPSPPPSPPAPAPALPVLPALPAPPALPVLPALPALAPPTDPVHVSLTGQVHYLSDDEQPPSKRPHLSLPSLSLSPPPLSLSPPPPLRMRRRIPQYRMLELRSGQTFHFSDDDGTDLLLPLIQEPNLYIRKLLARMPHRIRDRLQYLALFLDERENEVISADLVETDEWVDLTHENISPLAHLFTNLREELYTAYLREMRLRRSFRALLQRWRIQRIDKKEFATTDPITLTEPEQSVTVYDIPRHIRYVYDSNSLSTWIESNLKHYEGGFALPLSPRNPWTNGEFTEYQLLSIYLQLRAQGKLRWGLTTLREHGFNRERWQLFHRSALTLHAIRSSITRLDTVEARELFEDFIYSKMDALHIFTTPSIDIAYHRAILRAPNHWYLEELKAVAYIHYEAEHFGQNRRRMIHTRCDRIFQKQDQFIEELQRMGVLSAP